MSGSKLGHERCTGCPRKTANCRFYRKPWCGDCGTVIRFEQRLAREKGVEVVDVVVANGHLCIAYGKADGKQLSPAEMERLGEHPITRAEVLRELADAREQLTAEHRVGNARSMVLKPLAVEKARRFLELAAKYLPLLDAKERQEFSSVMALAGRFTRTVTPTEGLNERARAN
jgi:hypothetical protein